MIMKANKQIGFIYKNEESIDKILKDGDVVFERGFLREKTSTTLPITFGGVGKDLKDYRVYGNTVQSKLPSGYTQVDYIESSGTQYIDTGFKPNQNTSVEFKSIITQTGSSSAFYGARTSSSTGVNDKYVLLASYYNANNTSYQFNYGSGANVEDLNISYQQKNLYFVNKNKLYINNNLEITRSTETFTTSYNLYLMAVNTANTPSLYAKSKLYYFKIYNDTTLVRDFVPCYRNLDNEVGLYDLVNNVFYTNQGTGVFTYGSIAPTPDAPIGIVSCGDRTKNIFDGNVEIGGWSFVDGGVSQKTINENQIRCTNPILVEPNTTYVFSLNGIIVDVTARYIFVDKDNTILSSISTSTGIITTPANCKYLVFHSTALKNNYGENLPKPMIEENSSATPYEPYGYKIPVNVRSENLFDKDNANILNGYIGNDKFHSSTGGAKSFYIPCKHNTTYTILKVLSSRFAVGTTTNVPTNNEPTINYTGANTSTNITVTTSSNANYLCIYYYHSSYDTLTEQQILDSAMITEGSTVPSKYIPYYNETTNIYLDEPLRKIDEYSDYIDFINGKVVRNISEVVLNGSETWRQSSVRNVVHNIMLEDMLPPETNSTNYINGISDKFINDTNYNQLTGSNYNRYFNRMSATSDKYLSFSYETTTTINNWKTWLQSNNVTVDYVLATPTEESITLPNIPTIDGNNTLNIETEITPSQVYIKYKSNT